MFKHLAEEFLAGLNGQELAPPLHNSAPLVQTSGWTSRVYFEKFYRDRLPFSVFLSIKEGVGIMYIPLTKIKRLAEEAFEHFCISHENIDSKIQSCHAYESRIEELYTELTEEYFDTETEATCLQNVDRMRHLCWEYNALAFFSVGFDRDTVDSVLIKHDQKIDDEVWAQISKPPISSFERRHGWEVAERVASVSGLSAAQCQYYFASYDHVPTLAQTSELIERDYGSYLQAGLEKVQQEKRELEAKRRVYLDQAASLTKEEAAIARYVDLVIQLRDKRKDYLMMLATAAFRAARSLLKKISVDQALAGYLLFDELLKGSEYIKLHAQEITKRRQGFDVYVNDEGHVQTAYGNVEKNRQVIESYQAQDNNVSRMDTIQGQVGSSGWARGFVKIVLHLAKDAQYFEEGQILVAGMTRPEYVPIMKKASAIITDEGGITCHAAIVSRELNKPCVIGTKVATKILHDGDEVEVNADKGIVRIIKQSTKI